MFEVYKPLKIFSANQGIEFLALVDRCIESGMMTVLVDFSNVSFMDSRGLGYLIMALNRLREKQGQLVLCSVTGQTRMILEIADMEAAFEIYPSLDEYIQAHPD